MKNFTRKTLALMLAIITVVSLMSVVGFATPVFPTSVIIYQPGTNSTWSNISAININNLGSSDKVTSIKSSSTSVVKYVGKSNNSYSTTYVDKNWTGYSSKSTSIMIATPKTGTSTVSFKIGDTTYKTKVTVKSYVNPIKSMTITGINSGKNIASKFKTTHYYSVDLSKSISSATIKVTPVSGWVVSNIHISSYSSTSTGSSNISRSRSWSKGTTSASMSLGTIKPSARPYIYVTLTNTSNKATMDVYIDIY